ncbi:hypothetical protein [Sphingobacterium multivorum]|uniref:hypothetical protein n=1 Tax=Sphingobacterium multivorum TaxID=28454 RepID=UPI0028A8DE46|nr:hypothetical protein [Sphingobacterium multivorum]
MERKTESINNVRVDKSTQGDYQLNFVLTEKNNGLESINVTGIKNGLYAFGIIYTVSSSAISVNFVKDFDMSIVSDVLAEIEEIKGESNPVVKDEPEA